LWSTAELCFVLFKKKSIHPGAHVAIDLILFLGLLPALICQLILFAIFGVLPALLIQLVGLGPGLVVFIVL